MSRRTAILLLLALTVAGLLLVTGRDRRPSVVIISIDSLRSDHLGCYGYERPTSPFIDTLAAEGALFTTATSSTSWTLPAHCALFTGLCDSVHGCTGTTNWLARSRETLAERFQEEGYRTAGFFAGPLLHPHFGVGQGFATYHDCTSYSEQSIQALKEPGAGTDSINELSHLDVTGPITVENVGRWLEANSSGPRFLFIHLWDVHYDYIPPKPYDTMFDPDYRGKVDGRDIKKLVWSKNQPPPKADLDHLVALYDGEIRWTDDNLKRIFRLCRDHGMGEDTIFVITADHGEAFFEHGVMGHGQSLHDEEIRIPLVIHAPGRIRAGRRIDEPARIIDIAPTVLSLAGATPLAAAMGRDLSPLLSGGQAGTLQDRRPAVSELFLKGELAQMALRRREWKHLRDYRYGIDFFYDLLRDPGERTPLGMKKAPLPADRFRRLESETGRWLTEAARSIPTLDKDKRDTPDIPNMTTRQLRALGYLK